MEPKKNRSIGLIIRRFFAIFILFSTASGIVAQIETGTFTNETFGSAFVSLLIADGATIAILFYQYIFNIHTSRIVLCMMKRD